MLGPPTRIENRSGYVRGFAELNGRSFRPKVKVPFKLPWLALAAPEYSVLCAELDVVVAVLAGQEPGERLLDLDAVVDARLRRVVLLIDEVLEQERRLALRQVAAVGVEAVIGERHVLARPGQSQGAHLGV